MIIFQAPTDVTIKHTDISRIWKDSHKIWIIVPEKGPQKGNKIQ